MPAQTRAGATLAQHATWRRSAALLRAFRVEQSRPADFYGPLAEDSVAQLSAVTPLHGRLVLDVGGGPGWFADAFGRAGARYATVEADEGEFAGTLTGGGRVLGTALALPLASDSVDVCFSSNVLEHVPAPWTMCDEMVRVTRPGGVVVIAYTVWWGPWGGHETAPWHYLGGSNAARWYSRRHGHPPKNQYGRTLFPVTVAAALRWARSNPSVDVVQVLPRYLPASLWWLLRVPALREVLTWNLMLVLEKKGT